MNNTVVALVESTKTHPLYKKSYLRSKRFLVDDRIGVKMGDIVEFNKVRPISKMKHWRVEKVVGRNIEEIVEEELKEKAAAAVAEVMPEKEEVTKEPEGSEESKVEETEKVVAKKRVKKEKSS